MGRVWRIPEFRFQHALTLLPSLEELSGKGGGVGDPAEAMAGESSVFGGMDASVAVGAAVGGVGVCVVKARAGGFRPVYLSRRAAAGELFLLKDNNQIKDGEPPHVGDMGLRGLKTVGHTVM